MGDHYTNDWGSIIRLITRRVNWSKLELFVIQYVFQATVHTVWVERNRRRHNELSSPANLLVKRIDKTMRNKFTILQRRGDREMAGGMAFWFGTRPRREERNDSENFED